MSTTGNEGKGIDSDVIQLCDSVLTISPFHSELESSTSQVDSLNVSVATGNLIFLILVCGLVEIKS